MATRSAIGRFCSDGSIHAAYCHWDGSPEHQLPILREHYSSDESARQLIDPGSMSALRTILTWTHATRAPCPLYHSERGYGGVPAESFESPAAAMAHFRGMDCSHFYLFRPGEGWEHSTLD